MKYKFTFTLLFSIIIYFISRNSTFYSFKKIYLLKTSYVPDTILNTSDKALKERLNA